MEGKDKKKESIDEILSDLNGLLNKMPSILDGIKMPELQPMEAPKPQPDPEPQPPAADDADKTVVLQPFSGLPEGAEAPVTAEPPQQESDKTIILEPFAGLPEGSPEPEAAPEPAAQPESLAPQSLGDFMFGADSGQEPAAETPEQPAAPAKLSGSVLEPPAEQAPRPAAAKGQPLSISEFTPPPDKAQPPAAALPAFENTRDFGIPDIDALIQMSESGAAPEQPPAAPEAGVIPAAVQEMEAQVNEPSIQGLDGEEQPPAEVTIVENNEIRNEEQPAQPEQPAVQSEQPAVQDEQPAAQEEQVPAPSAFDAFAIDTSSAETAQPEAAGETLRLETPQEMTGGQALEQEPQAAVPSADAGGETLQLDAPTGLPSADSGVETLQFESPAAMPSADAGGETLRLESPQEVSAPDAGGETLRLDSPSLEAGAALSAEPPAAAQEPQFGSIPGLVEPAQEAAPEPRLEVQQPAPASGGIELSPAINFAAQPEPAAEPAVTPGADETLPGGSGLELSVGTPGGDATLVVEAHSSGSSGDEEKTVIFQAAPSTTSRAQAGDLEGLATKAAPEGIPAERQRSLLFVYSMEDKALCATVLAELDAICLKSATKPMFIKRAGVKECDPDVNPNFLQQSVAEAGAQGLVCLGNVPGDKVAEIESTFSSANVFFRYYDSSTFNHSSALDLVTDLIVR